MEENYSVQILVKDKLSSKSKEDRRKKLDNINFNK